MVADGDTAPGGIKEESFVFVEIYNI